MQGPRLYYALIPLVPEYTEPLEGDQVLAHYPIVSAHRSAADAVSLCKIRPDLGMVCIDYFSYALVQAGKSISLGYFAPNLPPFQDLTLY